MGEVLGKAILVITRLSRENRELKQDYGNGIVGVPKLSQEQFGKTPPGIVNSLPLPINSLKKQDRKVIQNSHQKMVLKILSGCGSSDAFVLGTAKDHV